jgi:quinol monooxygenase YgiN
MDDMVQADTGQELGMTKHEVRFTVDLTINVDKFDAFERVAQTMLAGTQKEPGALGYDWCLSADRRQCRLVETYEDSNAVLAHLTGPVVQELVPKLLDVSSISGFEVYGDPGPKAAEMLTGLGAKIFGLWRGFGS